MSEDVLARVLRALPGEAQAVAQSLGLSIEDTYAALVRLYDQGRAEMYATPARGFRARAWDRA